MVVAMDAALTVLGFLIIIGIHTIVTVVSVRFLRVRLGTSWAPFLYAGVFIPILFIPTTIVFSGVLSAGGATLDTGTLVAVVFLFPLAVGLSIDLFWLPSPDVVDVPTDTDEPR